MAVKISASDVKQLRDATGAGMMDCKKALTEAEGDFDKAVEFLRKKGQKLSVKRADRETKEGVVIAQTSDDRTRGIIVKLGCETDFVAKNQDYIDMAQKIADIALKNFPADVDALNALEFEDGLNIGDKVTEQIGVIGEKLSLDYKKLEADTVSPYIHSGYRAGVLVGLNQKSDDAYDAGRDVAMQVAAMRPIALDEDGVDASVIEKEIEIGKEQARQQGKPEEMLERIAKGKLGKFYKENTLLNQQYVKDSKKTVAQYLNSIDKDLTAVAFQHMELG